MLDRYGGVSARPSSSRAQAGGSLLSVTALVRAALATVSQKELGGERTFVGFTAGATGVSAAEVAGADTWSETGADAAGGASAGGSAVFYGGSECLVS